MKKIVIRGPQCHELEELNSLILRSKAVWGYDDAFMAQCRDELRLTLADLGDRALAVAECDGRTVGKTRLRCDLDFG